MVPATYQMLHPDNTDTKYTDRASHVFHDLISCDVTLFHATKYTLRGFHVFRDMHEDMLRKYCDEFCLPDVTVVPDMT